MILLEKLVNKSIVISVIGLAPVVTKLVRSNYKKESEKAAREGEKRHKYV